jgi:hypothetical protein
MEREREGVRQAIREKVKIYLNFLFIKSILVKEER